MSDKQRGRKSPRPRAGRRQAFAEAGRDLPALRENTAPAVKSGSRAPASPALTRPQGRTPAQRATLARKSERFLTVEAYRSIATGILAVVLGVVVVWTQPVFVPTATSTIGLLSSVFWFAAGWLFGSVYAGEYRKHSIQNPLPFLEMVGRYTQRENRFFANFRHFFGPRLTLIYVLSMGLPTLVAFFSPVPAVVMPVAGHMLAFGVWTLFRNRAAIVKAVA